MSEDSVEWTNNVITIIISVQHVDQNVRQVFISLQHMDQKC